jgi:hypothetical protein
MCCWAMPRGLYDDITGPILIVLHKPPNPKNGNRAILKADTIDWATLAVLDSPIKASERQLRRIHTPGQIVLKQTRHADDQYFLETNIITTKIIQIHNNVSEMTRQDAGEAVEEYDSANTTKEVAPLHQASAIMLLPMNNIE